MCVCINRSTVDRIIRHGVSQIDLDTVNDVPAMLVF